MYNDDGDTRIFNDDDNQPNDDSDTRIFNNDEDAADGSTRIFNQDDEPDAGSTRIFEDDSRADYGSTRIIDQSSDNIKTKQLNDNHANFGATVPLDSAASQAPHDIEKYRSSIPDRLRVILPDHSEQVFTSMRPYLIIGRSTKSNRSQVDIDLNPFDEGVMGISRVHAMIQPTNEGLMVKDLKSTNGSQLNGQRLDPNQAYLLHTGDRIKIGNLKIQVHFVYD